MLSDSVDLLKRQQLLYTEKNTYLRQFFEEIEPYDFYRYIFPVGTFERKGHFEDSKPNAIAVSIDRGNNGIALEIEGNGNAKRYTVTDELQEIDDFVGTDFTIMSPISYFGRRRTGKNARYLYAIVFDLDGVGMPQLRDVIHQMSNNILPKATFIVNSGTGLHLYYVLDDAIPMYPQNQKYLKELKYSLTRQIWNRYTSTIKEPQIQGIMQGFRVIGSSSKLGKNFPVVAFAFGDKISVDELISFIPDSNGERQKVQGIMTKSRLSIEEAKEKYPDWYERRIVRKERRGRWTIKRDLYDWWLNRIKSEIKVGHRFYGIMTLAIYAKKCCIDEKELRADAYSLLELYDEMSVEDINRFTKDDIQCALEMYNEDYVTFPRDDIAKLSGLQIEKNKRNYLKQDEHLQIARAVRDVKVKINGKKDWRDGNGRKSKKNIIYEFMKENPSITKKAAIARGAGVDRNTVIKYYDEIVSELQQEQMRSERLEQLNRDGHIKVKVTPSNELSDYLLYELEKEKNI
ncbi:MAG: hypothetical protein U0L73_07160 [Ruminococcus bromii]|jgi:hypothetical protein|nr:hypothetical protein [Ruminococcus bromii]